jgi:hypothetical protein
MTGTILAISRAIGETSNRSLWSVRATLITSDPTSPIQSVHRFTDPNLQLDIAPTSRISFHCLGGDYGVIDHFIITKRRCHLAAQPF